MTQRPVHAGPSVVNVYINYEKKFAFVEFRTGARAGAFRPAWCCALIVHAGRTCRARGRERLQPHPDAVIPLRAVEETSNAMALDGIMFEGVSVRVRRPNDYNPAAASALGPSIPNPSLNLAAIGLQQGGANAVCSVSRDGAFVGQSHARLERSQAHSAS